MKYIYQESKVKDFKSNIRFQELLEMTEDEFQSWLSLLRTEIVDQWDNHNIPPTSNFSSVEKIIKNWKKLKPYNTDKFIIPDESLGIIKNYNKFASGINQFFPTMGKTKITVSGSTPENSYSIYDYFTLPELRERFNHTIDQKVRRDGMYSYSKCVLKDYQLEYQVHSIHELFKKFKSNKNYGLFIICHKEKKPGTEYLRLTADEIQEMIDKKIIGWTETVNIDINELQDTFNLKSGELRYNVYNVRIYEKNTKLFPKIFQVFKLSFNCQPAVNFPALTAKHLYENYTSHFTGKAIVYDPSAGWGGRILGAMSSIRNLHYIGTDPNMENYIPEINKSRYEYVADFFNNNILGEFDDGNTFELFQDGSETIHLNPDFQKYKGKIDFIFTSPPYFNREQYSQNDTQSFKKYPDYQDWVNNFLRKTLETCYEYLKSNRYLAWNIANIKTPNGYIELEEISIQIMKELGAEYIGKHKMLLSKMMGIDNEVETLNTVKIDGNFIKYEPIFIFYKK